ncbi:hypothetical protein ACJMK2_034595 [Sinanodonta woodiana]|uniref:Uncharacterized protein n=1 Tax=Sinanodonta woodiana TaxID=1069815 RepID=A0ABD3WS45_SINWO
MDHQSRHKSSRNEINPLVQAAKEEVLPGYEEYLVLLQERNRLLKKLRKKSKKQMIMEKKEQGFTLYVNGANAPFKGQNPSPAKNTGTTPRPKSRKLKTAGEARDVRVLDQQSLTKLAKEGKARLEQQRAKTAPSVRERRRNWNMASVEIQTSRGDKQKIKAPEILTGNYEDDFEDSDEFDSSVSDDSMEKDTQVSKSYNSDEDDMEIDASKFKGKSSPKKPGGERKRQESKGSLDNEEDEDIISEKLFLTISDLKKLRQSLEMNSSIKQSMSKEASSDEDDIQRPPSIMEEEEEEVEEDLVSSMDNLSVGEDSPKMKKLQMFQPGDTIVLEFGGPVQKRGMQPE